MVDDEMIGLSPTSSPLRSVPFGLRGVGHFLQLIEFTATESNRGKT